VPVSADHLIDVLSGEVALRVAKTASCRPFTFDGQPDGVALETLTFGDVGDGRTRLHVQPLVGSFESRAQWLASGMETGVGAPAHDLGLTQDELRETNLRRLASCSAQPQVRPRRP